VETWVEFEAETPVASLEAGASIESTEYKTVSASTEDTYMASYGDAAIIKHLIPAEEATAIIYKVDIPYIKANFDISSDSNTNIRMVEYNGTKYPLWFIPNIAWARNETYWIQGYNNIGTGYALHREI